MTQQTRNQQPWRSHRAKQPWMKKARKWCLPWALGLLLPACGGGESERLVPVWAFMFYGPDLKPVPGTVNQLRAELQAAGVESHNPRCADWQSYPGGPGGFPGQVPIWLVLDVPESKAGTLGPLGFKPVNSVIEQGMVKPFYDCTAKGF